MTERIRDIGGGAETAGSCLAWAETRRVLGLWEPARCRCSTV